VRFSTVKSILESRIYLGEVLHNGEWFAGHHEAIITAAEFHAAHRGFGKGVRRSKDVLSGRVRCGLCTRRMAVNQNGKGSLFYKCRHRGEGCDQPARSTKGLSRAAVLGLSLLGSDERLQAAIRKELARSTHTPLVQLPKRVGHNPIAELAKLSEARRKLLDLYYASKISADGFQEEERRLCAAIEGAREQAAVSQLEERMKSDLELRFEEVARILTDLDIDAVWKSADDQERRVLIEELLEWVTVFPDHLEVKVTATPPLNVLFSEVGLMGSDFVGVGELAALARPVLTDQRFGDIISQKTMSTPIKPDSTGLVPSTGDWLFRVN
jgi:hypothetical protein